jgi:spore germination protein KA
VFGKIIKAIKFFNRRHAKEQSGRQKGKNVAGQTVIHKNIESNLANLKHVLGKSNDVIFREFEVGNKKPTKAFVCFIDGLGDKNLINEFITKALMVDIHIIHPDENFLSPNILALVKEKVLSATEVTEADSFDRVLDGILSGDTALFIDGSMKVLLISARGGETRAVAEPDTEVSVRGPRDGFTEILRVNTSLLRRKIKNPRLIFEPLRLGKQTRTEINIVYIEGIANQEVIAEVRRRLHRIDTDVILESGYLEQFIEDHPFSPFATIGNSEKPDKVAAKLLEGRIAILCNGTPFALTVPFLFIEAIQVSEDYYSRPYLASITRGLRLISFLVTLIVPALYVAVETFHQEMLPTVLLITMAAAREGIPFPSFVEAMIMGTIFEVLRESGIRLPRQVGQAVSIVGALIIGEAAVNAGILSAPMVIVGALTGITSFIVPALLDGIILFRIFLVLLSAAFGLYGIAIGLIIMLAHMCSLSSFGTPYLAPMAPTVWKDLQDTLIRVPLRLMKSQAKSISRPNGGGREFSAPLHRRHGGEDD